MRVTVAAIAIASLGLALTACAPVTPIGVNSADVLPAEAQRVIDRATATAGAIATQAAQATATGQSARESATAARGATLDALQARQTESALDITQQAAQALQAQQAAQNTQNYRATLAAQTPTAEAARQAATAAAVAYGRQQASAESMAEFWQTGRTLALGLLIVGGLTAICVVAIDALTRIRLARMAQAATIARESFRVLAPGHWAEWAPADGYQVYPLPGLLDAPATVIENTPGATPDRAHAWRQAVRLFAWWGDRYGFGLRELGPAGAGVVSDPAWRRLSKILRDAGVLGEISLPGKRGRATAWAPGWDYRRLHDELGHGRLALPYPADDAAPEVRYTVPNTTPQEAQHNTATQKS